MLGNHHSHATAARQSKGPTSMVSAQIGKSKYETQTRFKSVPFLLAEVRSREVNLSFCRTWPSWQQNLGLPNLETQLLYRGETNRSLKGRGNLMIPHPLWEAVGLFPNLFFSTSLAQREQRPCMLWRCQHGNQGAPLISFKRNNPSKACSLTGRGLSKVVKINSQEQ